ncbi:MAG: P-loop ATPase, Sll1717 family, partial [Candidatus Binataceae bacterium]
DISEPNANVTYEIGLAIGMRKPIRLIRAAHKNRKELEEIGLLHNIGHNDYADRPSLTEILTKKPPFAPWTAPGRNKDQPLYFVEPSAVKVDDELFTRVSSGIKKTVKRKFRSFNPREIDRLTAAEAFEQVSQSFGVIAIWYDGEEPLKQHQRTAFAIGLARGLEIPFLLIAHQDQRLPLDLDGLATRWSKISDIESVLGRFRDEVSDALEAFKESLPTSENFLDLVQCGNPVAESEAAQLDNYFIETEQFRLTLKGELNIILGRKGTGKTAIFLQVRDKIRADKRNIVIDLQPEWFQLVKLKEFIIRQLSYGTRKEFVAAFWEYIIWLEIAYKLLEKDAPRVRFDDRLLKAYKALEDAYRKRVERSGDFSERLTKLTDKILSRYAAATADSSGALPSSKLLEVVYGVEIRELRDEVMSYLSLKGVVFFLFDNLDRFWTPSGFVDIDASIIAGLVESLSETRKVMARRKIDFCWSIFLRSDVYEFVVKGMADYGKLSADSVEWNDRALLFLLLERRVLQGFAGMNVTWREVWESVSVQTIKGRSTTDFLIDASLMRPRYLIRLFETARRRAATLGKSTIDEGDYDAALHELGWQVLEDFSRELVDVVPSAEDLLFDIALLGADMTLNDLRGTVRKRVNDFNMIEVVIDVLIWTGCLGVRDQNRVVYISDCGFKRPFIRALLGDPSKKSIVFHPVLASIMAAPLSHG